MSNLKIMSWNCNGISQKIQELTTFIKLHNKHNPAWWNPNPNSKFQTSTYTVTTANLSQGVRTLPNGGTAVLVRRGIVHQHVIIPTELDSTSINVKLGNKIAQITAVYKSLGTTLKFTDLDFLINHSGQTHGLAQSAQQQIGQNSCATRRVGKQIFDRGLWFAHTLPVHPAHRPDVIDIFLLDTPNLNHILTNHCDLSSDHNPQILSLSSQLSHCGPFGARKRINWRKFKLNWHLA